MPLLDGGTFHLADRHPKRFTMLVFFRGLHCPVCRVELSAGNRELTASRVLAQLPATSVDEGNRAENAPFHASQ